MAQTKQNKKKTPSISFLKSRDSLLRHMIKNQLAVRIGYQSWCHHTHFLCYCLKQPDGFMVVIWDDLEDQIVNLYTDAETYEYVEGVCLNDFYYDEAWRLIFEYVVTNFLDDPQQAMLIQEDCEIKVKQEALNAQSLLPTTPYVGLGMAEKQYYLI